MLRGELKEQLLHSRFRVCILIVHPLASCFADGVAWMKHDCTLPIITINICTNNCVSRSGYISFISACRSARNAGSHSQQLQCTYDKYLHKQLCKQMGKRIRVCTCPVRTRWCTLICSSAYVFATVQLEMRGRITNNHDAHTTNICTNNAVNRWGNGSGVAHVPFARADVLWSAVQHIPLQRCS